MSIDWIIRGLEKPGKSRIGLAKAMGRSPSMITALLNGDRQLKASEIPVVANYLGVEPPSFAATLLSDGPQQTHLTKLEVVGEVAAGVWAEPMADTFERYMVDVPHDPRFGSEDQFLLRIRGTSINRRAASGSLVRCLRLHAAPRPPAPGDWVVAQRLRHGQAETTVKRLESDGAGGHLLWPDSTDAVFQEPMTLGSHDGDEVAIAAFVLDFINPATRF